MAAKSPWTLILAAGAVSLMATSLLAEPPAGSRPVREPAARDDKGVQRTVMDFKRNVTSATRDSGKPGGQASSTIQEPVTSTTSTGSSIMVPDGGSARLSSINSDSEGRRSSGAPLTGRPGRNDGYGRSSTGSQTTVTVRIIDFKEEEERLARASGGR